MRAELLNFVENQRVSQLADGTYDMQAAQNFKYKALMNELHVGDVYLRVFNEQPDAEIMNEQLSEVEVVPEPKPISQTRLETGPSEKLLPPVPIEDQSDVKAPTEEGEEKGDDVSSEATSDVSSSSSESPGKILVKKLTMALKALQV
jgi:DnaJ family protein C protein 13